MSADWWKGLHENNHRVTIGISVAIGIALIAIAAITARGQQSTTAPGSNGATTTISGTKIPP